MSDYNYRAYSPNIPQTGGQSPTRRSYNNLPSAATGGRIAGGTPYGVGGNGAGYGEGFEGWYDGGHQQQHQPPYPPHNNLTPQPVIVPASIPSPHFTPQPPIVPSSNSNYPIPPSLQPAHRGSVSSTHTFDRGDRDRDLDLAFGREPSSSRPISSYSTASSFSTSSSNLRTRIPDTSSRIRTPSSSSTEEIPRRKYSRDTGRSNHTPSPSGSPSRAIRSTNMSQQRTPSGSLMGNIFNAQNAAAVGSALGSAASFLSSRAGYGKNQGREEEDEDDYDRTPGGFNNPPPTGRNDYIGGSGGGGGLPGQGLSVNDALGYLSQFTGSQQQHPPPQTPPSYGSTPNANQNSSPFNLANAIGYFTGSGSNPQNPNQRPGNFQLAGIDIDTNWILTKAGEQNPWVLLGGGVVAFWIISSIIATLLWYAVIAGILYVVYLFSVGAGGPEGRRAVGGNERRGVGGGSSGFGGAGGGGNGARRRY